MVKGANEVKDLPMRTTPYREYLVNNELQFILALVFCEVVLLWQLSFRALK